MVELFFVMGLIPIICLPKVLFNAFNLSQTLALGLLSTTGILLGLSNGVLSSGAPSIISLIFLCYVFLSVLWAYPIHNAKKELGLQAPLLIAFMLGVVYLRDFSSVGLMALGFAIACGINALYGNLQTHLVDPIFPNEIKAGGPIDRAIGMIGNPNFLASFFAGTIWLGVLAAVAVKPFWIITSFAGLIVLYKTKSRAGQLALFCSLIFFIITAAGFGMIPEVIGNTNIDNQALFTGGIAYLILGGIFLVMVFKVNWETFWNRPIDPKGPQVWYASFRYRVCYWAAAWELIREKPLFGHGMWSYRREVYRAQARLNDRNPNFLNPNRYITPQPRECHNDLLEHLVEFGVVGTAVFLILLGVIYYHGFSYLVGSVGSVNFWMMLILMTNLTSIVVDAIFFFALRLPSTGLAFWLTSAAIVGVGSRGDLVSFTVNPLVIVVVGLCCIAFLWECVGKRVLASYYFLKHTRADDPEVKARGLQMAIHYQPYDTVYRTFACLEALEYDETMWANLHAMRMVEFFDGMTPFWATAFNVALAKVRTKNIFEEGNLFLKNSHWVLPTFKPSLQLLNAPDGIGVRSAYKGGQSFMRIASEEIVWKFRALAEKMGSMDKSILLLHRDIEKLEVEKQLMEANIQNTLLAEKKRLNIPDHWIFDGEKGHFLAPTEKDGQ